VSIFKLQQFSVKQTLSGMKICSDSLLFGALIPVAGAQRILDIGAGTGILSLMQAQKCNAITDSTLETISAVELTPAAAEEAQENFNNSPWADQLKIIAQDIQQFSQQHKEQQSAGYDVIICNPPFFVNQTKTSSNNPLRHAARHSDSLSFADLCQSIDRLLTAQGRAYLLLPTTAITEFCAEAYALGLKLTARIDIAESADHPVKVSSLTWVRERALVARELEIDDEPTLTLDAELQQGRLNKFKLTNVHSDEVRELLQPFLLRYL
jgi:tRNA1Val (adenine37-N6)-methyltransferase